MRDYDVMQVCLNGHLITDTYYANPEFRKNHCTKCGAKTITKCPNCGNEIKSDYPVEGVIDLSVRPAPVPLICEQCREGFPWKSKKKENTAQKSSINGILSLYKESVSHVPILKYSWVVVTTITILALAAYFKLKNSDVFLYAFAVLIISFSGFIFSFLLKTKDIFIRIALYFLVYSLIVTMCTAVLGLWSFIIWQKPNFYSRWFPNKTDTFVNKPDSSIREKHLLPLDTINNKITTIIRYRKLNTSRQIQNTGIGGDGGSGKIRGNKGTVIGGRGGKGGASGIGGKGGGGIIEGDGGKIIGGDGGDAAQADGRGGRGARGPTEKFGFQTRLWGYGYGGSSPNHPEYDRRLNLLKQFRIEYINKFPFRAPFIEGGVDQVPIDWINQRLVECNENWNVQLGDDGYLLPPLDK